MVRLFIALVPDAHVREQLALWRDAWTWPRSATPVKSERLHVTMHFLGDVEADRAERLADLLPDSFAPFDLAFGRAVIWPHGIGVLEPESVPAALEGLHAKIAVVLQDLGLPVNARPYRPHVTLARRAAGAVQQGQGPSINWRIDRYALMQSTFGPDGGYTILREFTGEPGRT
jgi:2'-5' RNA ligase